MWRRNLMQSKPICNQQRKPINLELSANEKEVAMLDFSGNIGPFVLPAEFRAKEDDEHLDDGARNRDDKVKILESHQRTNLDITQVKKLECFSNISDQIWLALVVVVVGGIHGGGGRCPAGERIRVGGGDGVRVVLGVSAAVVEVATNSSSCSALRRPSPRFAVPVLAVPSVGTSRLASLWVPSPSVALVLVVALAGVGVCTVLDGAAVVASRAPVAISALAGAAPGADSSSVGGSSRLVINILLQADAFGILVTGCLICSESCGSTLQVTLFLAISALIARQKSIGSLLKAPLLMVG
ncbi:hypothetical protein OsJ_27055 [Oryza sativa Japonica Group]|uniref:Uncharacterized protein n=1 Tax=Oryza sativa subsp. japonica TaxID=39947 RepID=B9G0K1_ORYSJ|nr:hypothetical protein OsJ_27055 [Oryza sativa Japonica Group]